MRSFLELTHVIVWPGVSGTIYEMSFLARSSAAGFQFYCHGPTNLSSHNIVHINLNNAKYFSTMRWGNHLESKGLTNNARAKATKQGGCRGSAQGAGCRQRGSIVACKLRACAVLVGRRWRRVMELEEQGLRGVLSLSRSKLNKCLYALPRYVAWSRGITPLTLGFLICKMHYG